ncbi:hypothetical protein BU23DRAFT_515271 [Bimuria novae-zelandiae CBS 107.79]|uniref:Zn(2)-C6 fungal-type domain-containing protein n=1 Tax=Bimuria novae-zelandiae CBS 107.79 TaxID=1447943 RepID=A0A6A5UWI2_9PLEO|nr:hypothetical protein BU23DRAFT_515271 [Bimuria novae-zelandiae CBS 107.79]
MPKESQQKLAGPRQRPVSCKFCRTRKLRCSRQSPCSNCLSRGIQCELEQPIQSAPVADDGGKAELLERIRKLEAIVEQSVRPTFTLSPTSSASSNPLPNALNGEVLGSFGDVAMHTRQKSIPSPTEQLDRDFAWLESIYDGTDCASDLIPSTRVGFRICSFQLVAEPEQFIVGSSSTDPSIVFWLPEYSEAKILLQKFIRDVEHVHHIVLTQRLPVTLDRAYSSLTQQGQVKSGDMILLLSIFAAAMHSWTPDDCRTSELFATCAEPHRRSALWVKASEDLLDIAHRTTRISIEGIQGFIIITFIAASYKGFSRRCWFLMNNALALAREIGLHCIDHPSNADSANTAEAEVGRRVWWYLVASDWAMATKYNGLARGTYTCHKRHMMTNKPLNINDEDVVDGMHRVGRPLTEPTQMSYFVLRIQLNEISRSIVDRAPLMNALPNGPSYDVVMDIDTEMQLLLNDVPPFFLSMPPFEIAARYGISPERAKVIARQGHGFRTLFYATRCKLHLPYARRGFTELDYATSRILCIDSARLIIQIESEYQRIGLDDGFARYKPILYSMTVFLACTILLMEYCHRKQTQAPDQEKSKMEICNALSMLEAARSESEIVSKFLDSLVTVLRNHGIAPPKRLQEGQQVLPTVQSRTFASTPSYSNAMSNTMPATPLNGAQLAPSAAGGEATYTSGFTGLETGSDLNDLVRSLDHGVDVDMIEWDDIFLGLGDSSFL